MTKHKILHVVHTMNTGGLEMVVKNILLQTNNVFDNTCLICCDEKSDFEQELIDNGISVYHLPTPDSLKVKLYRNLLEFFKNNHDYSIVHTHMSFSNGVVAKAAKKSGIKTVISHSHEMEREKDRTPVKRIYSAIMRHLILKNSDVYMACSTLAGYFLFNEKGFNEKGKVLYNGVDLNRFVFNTEEREKARKKLGIEDKIVLGNVGSLFPVKNQIRIVEMLKFNPAFATLIVGEGSEKTNLMNLASKEGVLERLILPGKTTEVEYYLNAMDVFVFPSTSEGFGVALIEAQANGLPCLVSEAIQDEAIVNKNIIKLNLNAGAEKWAEEALTLSTLAREKEQLELKNKGLDLNTNMGELISFYTSLTG